MTASDAIGQKAAEDRQVTPASPAGMADPAA
jgi:hypothetical protein